MGNCGANRKDFKDPIEIKEKLKKPKGEKTKLVSLFGGANM